MSKAYLLSEADVNGLLKLRRQVQRLEGRIQRPRRRRSVGGGDSRVWAKVSSNATKDGTYYGKSGARNSTSFFEDASGALNISTYYTFAGAADCVLVNFFEVGTGAHLLPVDAIVFGWRSGDALGSGSSKPLIELDSLFSTVFAVNCTSTSGSAYPVSFVYTVKTLDNAVTLGTGISPVGPRPAAAAVAGTKGLAYYDGTTLKLWSAGETDDLSVCIVP